MKIFQTFMLQNYRYFKANVFEEQLLKGINWWKNHSSFFFRSWSLYTFIMIRTNQTYLMKNSKNNHFVVEWIRCKAQNMFSENILILQ